MRDTAARVSIPHPLEYSPRNPSRLVGCKEHDDIGHVVRFADSFKRLHAERDLATRFRFGEIRHVCFDDTWGNSIHANAPRAKKCSPVLDERFDGAFG